MTEKNTKVIMLALVASAFVLSSTLAVAKTVRHKHSMPPVRSRYFYPNYNYGGYGGGYGWDGGASGGTLSNGRSASEAGGG